MKQFLITLLSGILILTACGQTSASDIPTSSIAATETNTIKSATSSPLPSRTPRERANEPTSTRRPPTLSPTLTATFDASAIVTVTPPSEAKCPQGNADLKPDLNILFTKVGRHLLDDQALLDFLNNGGTVQAVITAFLKDFRWFHPDMIMERDVTGDKVGELIITDNQIVYILGCEGGSYITLLSATDEPAWLQTIRFKIVDDINLNGIPEIITGEQGGHTYTSSKVSIFEWDGNEFLPLIQGDRYNDNKYFPFVHTEVLANTNIHDIDKNGTLDLVVESKLAAPISSLYAYLIPWRNEVRIYTWNGALYILNRIEYSAPEFRFQAIQDADREVSYTNFNKALLLYKDVISSDRLKAFSPEIAENEIMKSFAIDGNQPTPTSVSPDPAEYPRLAAYAYYRIMLLHLVQGNQVEAETAYTTLQQKFGSDPYGQPYVEMAGKFWAAYQTTHKMDDGCAAAIQNAVEHPEILIPLGSDYHGSQSHTYVPADVCPFR